MATSTFTFPTMSTASGNIYFTITYEHPTGGSTSVSKLVYNIGKINIPLESSPADQKLRYANTKINVFNIDDDFETNNIYYANSKNETFIKIYKAGSIYWSGLIDWEKSRKKDWYKDGATITYREIELYCVDVLSYLSNYDIDDTSITDGSSIHTIFSEIATLLSMTYDFTGGTTTWTISETSGNAYDLTDLRLENLVTTTTIDVFLKDLCLSLGLFAYTLDNKLYFSQRDNGTAEAVDNDNVLEIEKPNIFDEIRYVKITATVNWDTVYSITTGLGDHVITSSSGTQDVNTSKNFEFATSQILNNIYVNHDANAAQNPNPAQNPTGGTQTVLQDTGADFHTSDPVETGMHLMYNYSGALYDEHSIVSAVPSATEINFYSVGVSVDTGENYTVLRKPGNGVYKSQKCVEKVKGIYAVYFTTGEPINLTLRGLYNLAKKFTYNGNSYKVGSAVIDIVNYETQMKLKQVA